MPRGLNFSIEAEGADEVADRIAKLSLRFIHLEPIRERVMNIFEQGEERHFNRQKGRYVRTGALRDSLTQPNANGAIREAHGDEFVFGTSIFYARFLRKGRKSAVLVLQPAAKRQASAVLGDHIMGRL